MIIDLTETTPGEWSKTEPLAQLPPPPQPTAPPAHQPFWGDGESIAVFFGCMGIIFVIKHFF